LFGDVLKKFINSNLLPIKIGDFFDILVVSFLIYKLMTWIKNTRAWILFKGLITILIIFLLSSYFNLTALYFLISKAFNVGLIAIIILFQPEIRKALEQIGKQKFMTNFNNFNNKNKNENLSKKSIIEITEAIDYMAKKKTGALIVLTKKVPLGDFEQTGIAVDSLISKELIINIFEDKTPLHDGALIISENRIKAASCILPLSQSNLQCELGTRHRAAVGLSEISDAYIFIISEERGKISLAKNGKILLNLEIKELKNIFLNFNSRTDFRAKIKQKLSERKKYK
jgi:diadenylate cyclase